MQTQKEIIADIRKEVIIQDVDLQQLANELDTTSQNLSKILKRANPRLETLLKICNHLHLHISLQKDDTK